MAMLRSHSWPGNVRELRNAVERAYILADQLVELAPLQAGARATMRAARSLANVPIEVGNNLKEAERSLIEATLEHFDGNKTQTAVTLGCSLKTLYNKLNGYTRDTAYSS
jgi:DNA-binding NtrC family response regulator